MVLGLGCRERFEKMDVGCPREPWFFFTQMAKNLANFKHQNEFSKKGIVAS
jgi:hypothetical protein